MLEIYRKVRDHRKTDIRFVLGRYVLDGTGGLQRSKAVGEYRLHEAASAGSAHAKDLLNQLELRPALQQ